MAQASNTDLFQLDEAAMEAQLHELNEVDKILQRNEGFTIEDIQKQDVLAGITLDVNGMAAPQFGISDMDWGAFAWGFCCWPIGLFTVILNDNKDSDSKISYLIGVGTGVVLGAISYVIRLATYTASSL